MITLLKVEVNLVKAGGKSLTAIALGSSKAASLPDNSIKELDIPWQKLTENPDLFAYLSWHTQISEFAGREDEMTALQEWAASEPKISVKFVTGEGGTGKSRLAA
ncbi:MAG: ATP-binding protein, partial [Chlorobiales bacterium]|nr:ATP-binding protein [Chlorobiales bacterium]